MPTSQPQKSAARWIILFSIFFILMLIWVTPLGGYLKAPFTLIGSPVVKTTRSIFDWLVQIPKPLKEKSDLLQKLSDIEKKLTDVQSENAQLKAIITDDAAELKLKEYTERLKLLGISAHVIARSGVGQQTMTIDKGSRNGVSEGLPVITENGTIVGTIHNVTLLTSQVLLVTDPTQAMAAKVQNETASPGVVKGTYGVSLSLELIPQNDKLEVGQSIVTSSINPKIPANILIGHISKIINDEGSIFQKAQITLVAPIDRLEIVSILLTQDVNP